MRGRKQGQGWYVGEMRDKQKGTAANTSQPLTDNNHRLRLVSFCSIDILHTR